MLDSKGVMMRSQAVSLLAWVLCTAVAVGSPACTTMIVTKGASADGSMMVAHSDDDELGDQRMLFVPPRAQSGKRAVYREHYRFPRLNTADRGPGYDTVGLGRTPVLYELPYEEIWRILGHRVETSFAYFDGNYGIMNERDLMMGECTNGAKYEPAAQPSPKPGQPLRIFYSSELSRVAMENCTTAREAVRFMGGLLDAFGFYSTGETLLVADADEAWVFEMCALPDPVHHSAWVAKRVPEGEFFVAANEFRIRDVVKGDPDNFLYSENLLPGLKKLGWWDEAKQGPADWLRAVSPGEYNHPYYSLRRVWRVLDRVAPDLALSPWVEDGFTRAYPFSVKPSRKLSPGDVFALYRDHYEGTPFDLTRGVAAGPYGDPHRFVGPYDGNQNDVTQGRKPAGAWERAISVFYQGYTFVCQLRPGKPEATRGLVWFGPDVSTTTCFLPFFPKAGSLPASVQSGDPQKFERTSAWWAFNFVNNWSRLNFQRMYRADILPLQAELEALSMDGVEALDARVAGKPAAQARTEVERFGEENTARVLSRWWTLADTLVAKYSDGYVNLPDGAYGTPEPEEVRTVGYPSWWLDAAGYAGGPTSYEMK